MNKNIARGGGSLFSCVCGACLSIGLALAVFLAPTGKEALALGTTGQSALADACSIRCVDATSIDGDSFDVATVIGLGSNALYGDVSVDGSVKASDLEYRYDNADDQAGMIQLSAKASVVAQHSGSIELNLYSEKSSDRQGSSPLLSAKIYAVCASIDGQPIGSVVDSMIGVRACVAGDETQPFTAARLIVRGKDTYRLASGSSGVRPTLKDGVLYIPYEKTSQTGVSACVSYVDESGSVIFTDDLGSLEAGEAQTVDVRDSVTNGDRAYVPISKSPTVVVSAEHPEVIIHCVARQDASADKQDVTINYRTPDGTQLMTDKVSVGSGGLRYAAPTTFSQAHDGGVSQYRLAGATNNRGESFDVSTSSVLDLALNGSPEYTLVYEPQELELSYTVNLALVSNASAGTVSVSNERSLSAVFSESSPACVDLPDSIEKNGVVYTRQGSESSLSYSWDNYSEGRLASDTVYYVAPDVVAPSAYDVNVRYVDVVSGNELGSETLSCSPDGSALSISGPATLSSGGVEYVRLSGQDAAIVHRFFAPYRTYTIYYAVPGSASAGDVVVVRTVVTDGGIASYTVDVNTGAVSTAADGSAGLSVNAPYSTIVSTGDGSSDASQSSALTPNGQSAYEERIDGNETLLSSGDQLDASGESFAWLPIVAVALIALIAAVATAAICHRKAARRAAETNDSAGCL